MVVTSEFIDKYEGKCYYSLDVCTAHLTLIRLKKMMDTKEYLDLEVINVFFDEYTIDSYFLYINMQLDQFFQKIFNRIDNNQVKEFSLQQYKQLKRFAKTRNTVGHLIHKRFCASILSVLYPEEEVNGDILVKGSTESRRNTIDYSELVTSIGNNSYVVSAELPWNGNSWGTTTESHEGTSSS